MAGYIIGLFASATMDDEDSGAMLSPRRMVTEDIAAFRRALRPDTRLAGIDLGGATIGLAIATVSVGIASPLRTIRRTKFRQDAEALADLWRREAVGGLVLGLPWNMDGSAGPRVQSTRAFARSLQAFAPPPILLFDERLSSAAAGDALRESGAKRGRREAAIDAHAARIILQDAVDRLRAISLADRTDA